MRLYHELHLKARSKSQDFFVGNIQKIIKKM